MFRLDHLYLKINGQTAKMRLKQQSLLACRKISFHKSLISSSKFPVRFLARLIESDLRTTHGKNLYDIKHQCDIDLEYPAQIRTKTVKQELQYKVPPVEEIWRVNLSKELINMRDNNDFLVPGFTDFEVTQMLNYVCVT